MHTVVYSSNMSLLLRAMSWQTMFAALMVGLLLTVKLVDAAEYIDYVEDLYNTQNFSDVGAHNSLFNKRLDALTVTGERCSSGAYRGRAGNVNESFIYLNGDGIPDDAVTFAGVFDFENDLELAVFRGE